MATAKNTSRVRINLGRRNGPPYPLAPPVEHHWVATFEVMGPDGIRSIQSRTREDVLQWHRGETRQDQYRKVCRVIQTELQADGYAHGSVITF